jgi:hypothetical protein
VTKNYPGDESSGLERPGAFRVNMAAGKEAFIAHTGRAPRVTDPHVDADAPGPDALDAGIAHPVYGSLGWLAVTTPDRPPPLKYDGCSNKALKYDGCSNKPTISREPATCDATKLARRTDPRV